MRRQSKLFAAVFFIIPLLTALVGSVTAVDANKNGVPDETETIIKNISPEARGVSPALTLSYGGFWNQGTGINILSPEADWIDGVSQITTTSGLKISADVGDMRIGKSTVPTFFETKSGVPVPVNKTVDLDNTAVKLANGTTVILNKGDIYTAYETISKISTLSTTEVIVYVTIRTSCGPLATNYPNNLGIERWTSNKERVAWYREDCNTIPTGATDEYGMTGYRPKIGESWDQEWYYDATFSGYSIPSDWRNAVPTSFGTVSFGFDYNPNFVFEDQFDEESNTKLIASDKVWFGVTNARVIPAADLTELYLGDSASLANLPYANSGGILEDTNIVKIGLLAGSPAYQTQDLKKTTPSQSGINYNLAIPGIVQASATLGDSSRTRNLMVTSPLYDEENPEKFGGESTSAAEGAILNFYSKTGLDYRANSMSQQEILVTDTREFESVYVTVPFSVRPQIEVWPVHWQYSGFDLVYNKDFGSGDCPYDGNKGVPLDQPLTGDVGAQSYFMSEYAQDKYAIAYYKARDVYVRRAVALTITTRADWDLLESKNMFYYDAEGVPTINVAGGGGDSLTGKPGTENHVGDDVVKLHDTYVDWEYDTGITDRYLDVQTEVDSNIMWIIIGVAVIAAVGLVAYLGISRGWFKGKEKAPPGYGYPPQGYPPQGYPGPVYAAPPAPYPVAAPAQPAELVGSPAMDVGSVQNLSNEQLAALYKVVVDAAKTRTA